MSVACDRCVIERPQNRNAEIGRKAGSFPLAEAHFCNMRELKFSITMSEIAISRR